MELPSGILALARRVSDAGGRLYVVGGCVRDHVLGRSSGDIDVEVHGLSSDRVAELIRAKKTVGKSFGVYRFRLGRDAIDVALPQVDGEVRPHLGLAEAARRRDLRINALAWDPLSAEVIDPHGGLDDIASGLLRHVDDLTFSQDPLRALRAVRFSVTLGLGLSPELKAICAAQDLRSVPMERQRPELHRIFGSPEPGRGLALLRELGLLGHLPGLGDGLPSDTLDRMSMALDDQIVGAWALLLWRSSGVGWVDTLNLGRHRSRNIRKEAEALAAVLHDPPARLDDAALCRLAETVVVEVALGLFAATGRADPVARDRAEALGVLREPLPQLLGGKQLRAAGVPPGPRMGQLLTALREEQLDRRVLDQPAALTWLAKQDA